MRFFTYYLKDICDIKSGKRLPANSDFSKNETQYRYIRARDIKNGKISENELAFLDADTQSKIKKYIINEGDIAITIVANIGDVGYCTKALNGANLTENAVRLTNFDKDKVDSKFLNYYLSQPSLKQYMENLAAGAAQAKLGIYKINKIKVLLPDVDTQKQIAYSIEKYDYIIENNNKRIKILEEMAENLYKEWFVRFRFPGYENTEFENGIPKGWKEKGLLDVSDILYGYPFNSSLFKDEIDNVAVVRIRDILDKKTETYTSELCDEKYRLCQNDVLIGMDGIFHMCIWCGRDGYLNQRVVRIRSSNKDINNYFLYLAMYPKIKEFEKSIVGTTVAHLGDKHLKKMKLLIPTEDVLRKFNVIIKNILKELNGLQLMNDNLEKQRDALLPKLMSGKLEI